MKQLFEVGEVVIVQSPYYPETNGEYSVLGVFTYDEFREYCQGQFKSDGNPFIYKLAGYLAVGKNNPNNKTDCVSEPSLRKKQQPSELSFRELMTTLKSPQKVEWE